MITVDAAIVVPCYNEADRLDTDSFRRFVAGSDRVRFLFVNDGSSDGTLSTLLSLRDALPGRVDVIDVQPNGGKAEAVRAGLLAACDQAPLVGFWDADLATPLEVIPQFLAIMVSRPEIQWVLGSRVKLLGRRIYRSELRHYLGRVFATGASLTLSLGVYDTQCGAKLFRVTDLFRSLLAEPFTSRWIFDVELIARLAAAHSRGEAPAPADVLFEAALDSWEDVPGSKVRPWDFVRSSLELFRIWRRYMRPPKR